MLLDCFYEKPTPLNCLIRFNDSFSSYNNVSSYDDRMYHDDPGFSRRYIERGLEELGQEVPGSLERDQRISDGQDGEWLGHPDRVLGKMLKLP